ncbi:MAG: molybdopterin-dependent oxidoreductase [Chloroflexota bacterium]
MPEVAVSEHHRVYAELPIHPVPEGVSLSVAGAELSIGGLVARPWSLSATVLDSLPSRELAAPFACEEGWSVPNLLWVGPRLADVVALAEPLLGAAWVRVISGDYAVPIAWADCQQAVLARRLNGQWLTVEQGGPWRLIVPGGSCFTSVKWVELLEVATEPGSESGQAIALARLKRAM